MADNLTDEEQLQVLRNWWKENGTSILLVLVVGLGAYFGWQWWTQHQKNYAEEASVIYSDLQSSLEGQSSSELLEEQRTTAEFLIDQLQNDYAKSQYAVSASLYGAKIAVDQGDLAKAESQLNWIIETGDEDAKTVAGLRLARVLLAQEKYEQALSVSTYAKEDRFTSLFADVQGDILVEKGDVAAAKEAYQRALDTGAEQTAIHRRIVEVKLADLVDQ